MSERQTENPLTVLLNKIEAMIDSEAGTISEIGAYLVPNRSQRDQISRACAWIRERRRRPNGETALRMHAWAAAKTVEISVAGRKAEAAYRQAFDKITAARGTGGGEE